MDLAQVIQAIKDKFPTAIAEEQPTAVFLKKEQLLDVAKFLKDELSFDNCHCISGLDRKDKIEVVYFLYSFKQRVMFKFKVALSMDDLTVETLSGLWRSADWLERETFDLFGVKFLHHPDMRRILNPDEWTDWPLRKNFDRPDFHRLPQTEGLKAA